MSPTAPHQSIEILMVDDDDGDIRITQEALKDSKLRNNMHIAHDGEEALRFLRQEGEFKNAPRPDLVLLDLNMPRKDGHETLAEIRADPALTDLIVVVLTTSTQDQDVAKSYKLHANAFVSKPVDLDRFITVVKQIEDFWFNIVRLPSP